MLSKRSLVLFLIVLGAVSIMGWYQQTGAQAIEKSKLAITTSGPVIGQSFNISREPIDENSPSVAYNPVDREYLVVWENIRPSALNDIYAQRISEHGEFLSSFYVAKGDAPNIAYNNKNNTFLIVYQQYLAGDYDVYGQRVDYRGPFDPEFPIAFNLGQTEHHPVVAYNTNPKHDEFLIVWENIPPQPSNINKVEGQRVAGTAGLGDGGLQTIGPRIPIATSSDYYYDPDLAYNLNMNEYMVVFKRQPGAGGDFDVYGRRVTWDGHLPQKDPVPIDSSGGDQSNPSVAAYRLNQDTPYLVVFNDTWNDPTSDIRGYLLNKEGQPVQLINIAVTSGEREFDPAIAQNEAWDGYFISWTQGPSNDHDIFGIQVSDTGDLGPEFDISGYASMPVVCNRRVSDIAVGNLAALAVWEDPCGNFGGFDVLGRFLGHRINLPILVR